MKLLKTVMDYLWYHGDVVNVPCPCPHCGSGQLATRWSYYRLSQEGRQPWDRHFLCSRCACEVRIRVRSLDPGNRQPWERTETLSVTVTPRKEN